MKKLTFLSTLVIIFSAFSAPEKKKKIEAVFKEKYELGNGVSLYLNPGYKYQGSFHGSRLGTGGQFCHLVNKKNQDSGSFPWFNAVLGKKVGDVLTFKVVQTNTGISHLHKSHITMIRKNKNEGIVKSLFCKEALRNDKYIKNRNSYKKSFLHINTEKISERIFKIESETSYINLPFAISPKNFSGSHLVRKMNSKSKYTIKNPLQACSLIGMKLKSKKQLSSFFKTEGVVSFDYNLYPDKLHYNDLTSAENQSWEAECELTSKTDL